MLDEASGQPIACIFDMSPCTWGELAQLFFFFLVPYPFEKCSFQQHSNVTFSLWEWWHIPTLCQQNANYLLGSRIAHRKGLFRALLHPSARAVSWPVVFRMLAGVSNKKQIPFYEPWSNSDLSGLAPSGLWLRKPLNSSWPGPGSSHLINSKKNGFAKIGSRYP